MLLFLLVPAAVPCHFSMMGVLVLVFLGVDPCLAHLPHTLALLDSCHILGELLLLLLIMMILLCEYWEEVSWCRCYCCCCWWWWFLSLTSYCCWTSSFVSDRDTMLPTLEIIHSALICRYSRFHYYLKGLYYNLEGLVFLSYVSVS